MRSINPHFTYLLTYLNMRRSSTETTSAGGLCYYANRTSVSSWAHRLIDTRMRVTAKQLVKWSRVLWYPFNLMHKCTACCSCCQYGCVIVMTLDLWSGGRKEIVMVGSLSSGDYQYLDGWLSADR